jgi:hypothetical protein
MILTEEMLHRLGGARAEELRVLHEKFEAYYKRLWAKHEAKLMVGIDIDALSHDEWNDMDLIKAQMWRIFDEANPPSFEERLRRLKYPPLY